MIRAWNEEADARAVVADKLGGATQVRDPGGGSVATHDFDLILGDGRRFAFEVTRHAAADQLERLAVVSKKSWAFPGLRSHWVVKMPPVYDVKALHRNIASLVEEVEASGGDSFNLREPSPVGAASAALDRLRSLGVRYMYKIGPATAAADGQVVVGDASVVGSTAADVVVAVAEEHANKADNAGKLHRAEGDERHMFVWVDGSAQAAAAAMQFGDLPDVAPVIPEWVDAVWLASAYLPADVWQYHRALGWQDLGSWGSRGEDDS